jgi:histone chaperone ASF1
MLSWGADIEWKLIYVGSAEDEKYDQVLDSVLVGPITPGQYRFVFQVRQEMTVKFLPSLARGLAIRLITGGGRFNLGLGTA